MIKALSEEDASRKAIEAINGGYAKHLLVAGHFLEVQLRNRVEELEHRLAQWRLYG